MEYKRPDGERQFYEGKQRSSKPIGAKQGMKASPGIERRIHNPCLNCTLWGEGEDFWFQFPF